MRKLKTGGAGSGSDGEVTAGEMSDGAGAKIKKKKIKVIGSGQGSPSASRAGSPNPGQGSKYSSKKLLLNCANSAFSGASPVSSAGKGIEAWEIVEKIPPEGITIGELIKPFLGRIGDKPGQMLKKDWIDLVKVTCDYGPDKRLRRRNR
jgi:transcription initiation factor TFIIF subunit alpha